MSRERTGFQAPGRCSSPYKNLRGDWVSHIPTARPSFWEDHAIKPAPPESRHIRKCLAAVFVVITDVDDVLRRGRPQVVPIDLMGHLSATEPAPMLPPRQFLAPWVI